MINAKLAILVARPSVNNIPPTNSVTAPKKPQIVGRKWIPNEPNKSYA